MAGIAEAIAAGRGPNRKFYGWAIVTVEHASQKGRSVRASPLSNNPYHADIDLHLTESAEDDRLEHAADLASKAQWKEWKERPRAG